MSAVGMCPSLDDQKRAKDFLRVRCEANGSGRDCRILELDARGAFIESFVPVVAGTTVNMRFRLPNGHQVCTAGVVHSHRFTVGFGVDFTDISCHDREQIASLIG